MLSLIERAKPIFFTSELREAIRINAKTTTRRIILPQPMDRIAYHAATDKWFYTNGMEVGEECKPKYMAGDIIYIPEPWKCISALEEVGFSGIQLTYKENPEIRMCLFQNVGKETPMDRWAKFQKYADKEGWQSPYFMPKEAARIFLFVKSVRAEPLQNIITGDYMTPININREGIYEPCSACNHFNSGCTDFIKRNKCNLLDEWIKLWDSTTCKEYFWNSNPWVWVYEFEKFNHEM